MVKVLKELERSQEQLTKTSLTWLYSCISGQGVVLVSQQFEFASEQWVESGANNTWRIAAWRSGVHARCPALPKKLLSWLLRVAMITSSPSKGINARLLTQLKTIGESHWPCERFVDIEENWSPFNLSNRECLHRPPWHRQGLARSKKLHSSWTHWYPLWKTISAN